MTITAILGGVAAALLAIIGALFKGKRDGYQKAKGNAAIQDQKAQERGRKAVSDGRRSGNTPDERLRRNDGRW